MRLNLFIARSGYTSRRKADALIKEGRVKVNRRPVKQPFFQVTAKDEVKVEDSLIAPQGGVYIIFNKPKGITVTLEDKFADKKIIDYLPRKFSSNCRSFKGGKRVYPAGRLDKNSQGLIVLTNDGKLCYRITHPKFAVEKEYFMKLNCRLS